MPMNSVSLLIASLWTSFVNPDEACKPWTYYFWANSLTDKETITLELADIHRLGFGGILLVDSRGYWDDENHVKNPPATMRWGSEAWLDLIEHTMRECAKNDIGMTLNIAASGGHLRGDAEVGDDAPKFLNCKMYLPGDEFEKPDLPNYKDVAAFAIRTAEKPERRDWLDAGDGQMSMEGSSGKSTSKTVSEVFKALEVREIKSPKEANGLEGNWVVLRFGRATARISSENVDIDVLDRDAVVRHLERVVGRLMKRAPGLIGKDRTLRGLYNVSWEGLMPTWSKFFEADFKEFCGYELRDKLPVLAGFELKGVNKEKLMKDFRRARGKMMVRHLYAAVKEWANARNMIAISESGGPWGGSNKPDPRTFGECDQYEFLAANDIPQGEFWPVSPNLPSETVSGRANNNGRFFMRGIVDAAHRAGRNISSIEAFTHMMYHWSVDPQYLKPLSDQAFADGINLVVWHTYTTSPAKYGVPGLEYFAGSHINRNVTWNRHADSFVKYLWRCQSLLQKGKWVDDGEFLPKSDNYFGWGRHRKDEKAQFTTTHRIIGGCDVFFVAGEGAGEVELNAKADGRSVEIWDAVEIRRRRAKCREANSKTFVALDLPRGGSAFVVFAAADAAIKEEPAESGASAVMPIAGKWEVAFSYHPGVEAEPPAAMSMDKLVEWTTVPELKYFAGTAIYVTTFNAENADNGRYRLSLGEIPSGLAKARLNGIDCGTVWCVPWEVEVGAAVKNGENRLEIEYVNNWHNRLVGDCFLEPDKRVTKSVLRYWNSERQRNSNIWAIKPTIYSGPSISDELQPSGLLGPVMLKRYSVSQHRSRGLDRPAD